MKESYLYKKLPENKVQCQTCSHYCSIAPQKRGICAVRENKEGKLLVLNYGKVVAYQVDPIEKKPFFHFLPGTRSLSVATVGCNFKCDSCQNFDISQMPQLSNRIIGEDIFPKETVELAKKSSLPSISFTYTEPTIFLEYALDTMKIAKEENIKNTWVTNGFMSEETLSLISPYLDAVNIDLKAYSDKFYQKYCGGRLQPVLDNLIRLKEKNIWTEITTLVIPTLNNDQKTFEGIAKFIKENLGEETPWHVTQFCGAISWKLKHLPTTSVETLKKAHNIGKKAGLKYVYTGNVPGLPSEDTFCPKCGSPMISRTGYVIHRHDKEGKCSKCGENLNLILK